ncbi:cell cycle control protein 50A-like isoform X2 [Dendronephthya gigantea]|uniref:cell cycle control protein 50A-like isoform X2 n=1 Tax=Dendronephthya gigantea TaxID=151771 RepID=UPI00106DC392|nr:cell cycle control protein 50A-like isoform X2 [Dendronephthya gigantea]
MSHPSQNMEENVEDKNSRRPKNSAFKQQRLKAWQPILTAQVATIFFLVIFVLFIILGAVLLVASDSVRERVVEYTNCHKDGVESEKSCAEYLEKNVNNLTFSCKCKIKFELEEDIDKQVYLYYGLSNFYQNHRRYVRSRDDAQLRGDLSTSVASDCKPYDKRKNNDNTTKPIAPCGTIANSMFNDSFELYFKSSPHNQTKVGVTVHNIAWKSDRETKFQNPDTFPNELKKDFVKPPNWRKPVYELDKEESNNGFENQEFIVWMRTAAFPKFRKPYRKVNHENMFEDRLPKGEYILLIDYNYPVISFDGEKRFIISNTSWLGGKNPFLGIAYLVVGSISALMSGVFFYIHLRVKSRSESGILIEQS